MTRCADNLRGPRFLRGALWSAPALASALALTGVTAKPAVDVVQAREACRNARERLSELPAKSDWLEEFERRGAKERCARLGELMGGRIPAECTELELFSAVRFLSEHQELALDSVQVRQGVAEHDSWSERGIGVSEVRIAGRGRLGSLTGLVGALRAEGYPTAVLELSISRADVVQQEFEVRAALGIFARATAAPSMEHEGSLEP